MEVNGTSIINSNVTNVNLTDVSVNASPEMTFGLNIVARRHVGWAFLLIFLLATFGNIVIIIVMNNPRNKKLVSSTFFTGLAVSDLLHAGQISMENFFMNVLSWSAWTSSTPSYLGIFRIALSITNTQISTWILVSVTVERLLCILLPFNVKNHCTQIRAKIWIFVICVSCLSLNMTALFLTLDMRFTEYFPIFIPKFSNAEHVFFLYEMICGFILPFLVICFGSIVIVFSLCRRKGGESASARANSATRSSILANIAFVITFGPIRLFSFIKRFEKIPFTPTTDLLNYLTIILVDSNAAVNFFVYCLGSPRFRQDVKTLFGLKGND